MNHYYEKLFDYVAEILIMSEESKEACRKTFKPIFVPKDTIIEAAGAVPQYHNFIVSGYMRNFHLDDNGNEITTDLNNGSRFFTSYFHFMNQTVTNENMHCITDCELLRISFEDVGTPETQSQEQKDYTIKIFQNLLLEEKQRIFDMANLTAEQRYQKFLIEKPNIIQNVPLNYIASYLGITQRHLSRLRKEIST
jgi:CRP/FNR family transcriptional regulator, anaerobic regulatory protein